MMENDWWSAAPTSETNAGAGLDGTTEISNWLEAKAAVRNAQARLDEATFDLCAKIGLPDEGTNTVEQDGYKVSATQRINFKADHDRVAKLDSELREQLFKVSYSVMKPALNQLAAIDERTYHEVCECLTSSPAKPSISIKEPKSDE